MADEALNFNLPADLPEDWVYGQVVAPTGDEAGLSEQHGYNYLNKQVNAAQKAANLLGQAAEKVPDDIRAAINTHNSSDQAHADLRAALAGLESELKLLKLKYDTDIAKNPFTVTFGTLDGTTTAGVWNVSAQRIEF